MSSPAPGSDRAAMVERYGVRSGRRWPVIVLTTALGAVFLGWLAWTAIFHATPEVSSELVGWDVVDEHRVVSRTQVQVSQDTIAQCRVRALAEDHTVVGEIVFEVTDVDDGDTLEQTIRTERRATTVERIGCTTADQPRPR